MFAKSDVETLLEKELVSSLKELETIPATDDNYGTIVDRVSKLHKLKSDEQTKLPSLDTALVVCANIAGILLVTHYERDNVIASKALGFVMRLR